jgi:endoglucanase
VTAAVAAAVALSAALTAAAAPCDGIAPWPHWERYREVFLARDGRIVDRTAGDRSTSEGQAYALFFALVAGDRDAFERVLRWSRDNLAQGDLAAQLPAWHWGARRDGGWGVLDANSASDADLWMAYALLEAGRLWRDPEHERLARRLLANVAAREIATLPGLGPMLLPAPRGFALERGRGWRLNPSYLPPQLLARFASAGVPGPWLELRATAARMLRETAPRGVVADWVLYRSEDGFGPDPVHGAIGSYDAIRTYLWAGTLAPAAVGARELVASTGGLLELLAADGAVPEKVDVRSLRREGRAPVGFHAALLPLARARQDAAAARRLLHVVEGALRDGLYGAPPAYYDQNLALFALGFAQGRYRFEADGKLTPAWEATCAAQR